MNNLIKLAAAIPVSDAVPILAASPVTLSTPDRGLDLEMKVTAPVTDRDLPIILLSHGHGPSLYIPSLHGYGPLADFWAAHGFVVIQPTHLNSKVAGLDPSAPGGPAFWRSRVEDMVRILDRLDEVVAQVPTLAGRVDPTRIAAAGHSLGGQTVGMLLGARLTDPHDPGAIDVNLKDSRIKVGVLLAAPGRGGNDLNPAMAANPAFSFLNPDFSHLTTPALVIVGDADVSPHLTPRSADWHADAYHLSPGADFLLTLYGGKHGLGGVAGYEAAETTDEDPDRLAVVQRLSCAYLRTALNPGDPAWSDASDALRVGAASLARVESKSQ
ncbi:alpha/beta hydrolase family protein [Sphingomonas bacterium]|uniref:alpha/beta hydrolase family protein n=1 Tax=Sphingomonas bacterium TaxID=1895847 RepID=UPI0015764D86|nr:chlorophyllase [Sphingomonas bacterium]